MIKTNHSKTYCKRDDKLQPHCPGFLQNETNHNKILEPASNITISKILRFRNVSMVMLRRSLAVTAAAFQRQLRRWRYHGSVGAMMEVTLAPALAFDAIAALQIF